MKTLIILGVLILTSSFISCSKRYTCSCTYIFQGESNGSLNRDFSAKNQDDAISECDAVRSELVNDPNKANISCTLK